MKKILPFLSIAMLPLIAEAQDFEFAHDTAFVYTEGTADAFEIIPVENTLTNTSDMSYTYTWQLLNPEVLPSSWAFQGFCDNVTCYTSSSPNLWYEGNPVTSGDLAAGAISELKLQMYIETTDENTEVIFKFKISTDNQEDTAYYLVSKSPLGISVIPMDDHRVGVYPNPSSQVRDLNIFISKELNAQNMVITDILGKQIGILNLSTHQEIYKISELGNITSGHYFVHVLGKSGEHIATRKFVVNN